MQQDWHFSWIRLPALLAAALLPKPAYYLLCTLAWVSGEPHALSLHPCYLSHSLLPCDQLHPLTFSMSIPGTPGSLPVLLALPACWPWGKVATRFFTLPRGRFPGGGKQSDAAFSLENLVPPKQGHNTTKGKGEVKH